MTSKNNHTTTSKINRIINSFERSVCNISQDIRSRRQTKANTEANSRNSQQTTMHKMTKNSSSQKCSPTSANNNDSSTTTMTINGNCDSDNKIQSNKHHATAPKKENIKPIQKNSTKATGPISSGLSLLTSKNAKNQDQLLIKQPFLPHNSRPQHSLPPHAIEMVRNLTSINNHYDISLASYTTNIGAASSTSVPTTQLPQQSANKSNFNSNSTSSDKSTTNNHPKQFNSAKERHDEFDEEESAFATYQSRRMSRSTSATQSTSANQANNTNHNIIMVDMINNHNNSHNNSKAINVTLPVHQRYDQMTLRSGDKYPIDPNNAHLYRASGINKSQTTSLASQQQHAIHLVTPRTDINTMSIDSNYRAQQNNNDVSTSSKTTYSCQQPHFASITSYQTQRATQSFADSSILQTYPNLNQQNLARHTSVTNQSTIANKQVAEITSVDRTSTTPNTNSIRSTMCLKNIQNNNNDHADVTSNAQKSYVDQSEVKQNSTSSSSKMHVASLDSNFGGGRDLSDSNGDTNQIYVNAPPKPKRYQYYATDINSNSEWSSHNNSTTAIAPEATYGCTPIYIQNSYPSTSLSVHRNNMRQTSDLAIVNPVSTNIIPVPHSAKRFCVPDQTNPQPNIQIMPKSMVPAVSLLRYDLNRTRGSGTNSSPSNDKSISVLQRRVLQQSSSLASEAAAAANARFLHNKEINEFPNATTKHTIKSYQSTSSSIPASTGISKEVLFSDTSNYRETVGNPQLVKRSQENNAISAIGKPIQRTVLPPTFSVPKSKSSLEARDVARFAAIKRQQQLQSMQQPVDTHTTLINSNRMIGFQQTKSDQHASVNKTNTQSSGRHNTNYPMQNINSVPSRSEYNLAAEANNRSITNHAARSQHCVPNNFNYNNFMPSQIPQQMFAHAFQSKLVPLSTNIQTYLQTQDQLQHQQTTMFQNELHQPHSNILQRSKSVTHLSNNNMNQFESAQLNILPSHVTTSQLDIHGESSNNPTVIRNISTNNPFNDSRQNEVFCPEDEEVAHIQDRKQLTTSNGWKDSIHAPVMLLNDGQKHRCMTSTDLDFLRRRGFGLQTQQIQDAGNRPINKIIEYNGQLFPSYPLNRNIIYGSHDQILTHKDLAVNDRFNLNSTENIYSNDPNNNTMGNRQQRHYDLRNYNNQVNHPAVQLNGDSHSIVDLTTPRILSTTKTMLAPYVDDDWSNQIGLPMPNTFDEQLRRSIRSDKTRPLVGVGYDPQSILTDEFKPINFQQQASISKRDSIDHLHNQRVNQQDASSQTASTRCVKKSANLSTSTIQPVSLTETKNMSHQRQSVSCNTDIKLSQSQRVLGIVDKLSSSGNNKLLKQNPAYHHFAGDGISKNRLSPNLEKNNALEERPSAPYYYSDLKSEDQQRALLEIQQKKSLSPPPQLLSRSLGQNKLNNSTRLMPKSAMAPSSLDVTDKFKSNIHLKTVEDVTNIFNGMTQCNKIDEDCSDKMRSALLASTVTSDSGERTKEYKREEPGINSFEQQESKLVLIANSKSASNITRNIDKLIEGKSISILEEKLKEKNFNSPSMEKFRDDQKQIYGPGCRDKLKQNLIDDVVSRSRSLENVGLQEDGDIEIKPPWISSKTFSCNLQEFQVQPVYENIKNSRLDNSSHRKDIQAKKSEHSSSSSRNSLESIIDLSLDTTSNSDTTDNTEYQKADPDNRGAMISLNDREIKKNSNYRIEDNPFYKHGTDLTNLLEQLKNNHSELTESYKKTLSKISETIHMSDPTKNPLNKPDLLGDKSLGCEKQCENQLALINMIENMILESTTIPSDVGNSRAHQERRTKELASKELNPIEKYKHTDMSETNKLTKDQYRKNESESKHSQVYVNSDTINSRLTKDCTQSTKSNDSPTNSSDTSSISNVNNSSSMPSSPSLNQDAFMNSNDSGFVTSDSIKKNLSTPSLDESNSEIMDSASNRINSLISCEDYSVDKSTMYENLKCRSTPDSANKVSRNTSSQLKSNSQTNSAIDNDQNDVIVTRARPISHKNSIVPNKTLSLSARHQQSIEHKNKKSCDRHEKKSYEDAKDIQQKLKSTGPTQIKNNAQPLLTLSAKSRLHQHQKKSFFQNPQTKEDLSLKTDNNQCLNKSLKGIKSEAEKRKKSPNESTSKHRLILDKSKLSQATINGKLISSKMTRYNQNNTCGTTSKDADITKKRQNLDDDIDMIEFIPNDSGGFASSQFSVSDFESDACNLADFDRDQFNESVLGNVVGVDSMVELHDEMPERIINVGNASNN